MKPMCLFKTVFFTGLWAVAAFPATWPQSLADAISSHDPLRVRQLVESRPSQCEAIPGLNKVATILKSKSVTQAAKPEPDGLKPVSNGPGPWTVPAFEWALRPDFGDACYFVFEARVLDPTAPESFRMALINVMTDNAKRLKIVPASAIHTAFVSILFDTATTPALKSFILRKVGRMAESSYDRDLLPFLSSQDSIVRSGAIQGLVQKINANGHSGKKEENAAIFSSFERSVSQSITQDQVRVIATFREDYSRDFLLSRCAGDSKKVATIFIRDGNVRHGGLISEAARLLRSEENPAALEKAVAQGLKDPESTLNRLLAGNSGDQLDGLALLLAFPRLVPTHVGMIDQYLQGSDPDFIALASKLRLHLQAAASK